MSYRRSVVAGAVALAVSLGSVQLANAQGFGRGGAAYTPEEGSREMKDVLFNWTWHMGMLRGESEVELIETLEYRATGTVQVNGQPCTLAGVDAAPPGELVTAGYRISVNYRIPGYRTHIDCTLPNGQAFSNIETISGDYVWDEDIPGAEIVPGEGTASPNPSARDERLIRLWASPQGAAKAATAAAAGVSTEEAFTENPARFVEQQREAGARSQATLEWQGRRAIISYPVPGVPGALATATLREDYLLEEVVVEYGDDRYEFLYDDYQDFNNPYHRIEALYAGSVVERHNGVVVRDLQTAMTEIGQVYVVVPVPESVRAAGPARN